MENKLTQNQIKSNESLMVRENIPFFELQRTSSKAEKATRIFVSLVMLTIALPQRAQGDNLDDPVSPSQYSTCSICAPKKTPTPPPKKIPAKNPFAIPIHQYQTNWTPNDTSAPKYRIKNEKPKFSASVDPDSFQDIFGAEGPLKEKFKRSLTELDGAVGVEYARTKVQFSRDNKLVTTNLKTPLGTSGGHIGMSLNEEEQNLSIAPNSYFEVGTTQSETDEAYKISAKNKSGLSAHATTKNSGESVFGAEFKTTFFGW